MIFLSNLTSWYNQNYISQISSDSQYKSATEC